jgi:MoxR-vWA-beta-propeller ternary system domain bpX5
MITWGWERRLPPLDPAAVVGRGPVRDDLARRIAADPDPTRLRVTASGEWMLALGRADDLPWVDGAAYLGWDHGILLPTTRRPAVPMELLARSLRRSHPAELIALLPGGILTSVMPAHPVDVTRLGARS